MRRGSGLEKEYDRIVKNLEAEIVQKQGLEEQVRELDVRLARQQHRAEAAEAKLREAERNAAGSNEDIIKALRTELRCQEAEIAAARKLQGRSKYALEVPHLKGRNTNCRLQKCRDVLAQ